MLKASLVVFGIVLASGGLALAQQSSPDAGPPKPPPKPAGHHHHRPPPPGGPASLQGKGFDLRLGHGRGLRVQCGDEPLKNCVQAVQPLIRALAKSGHHRPGRSMHEMRGGQPGGPGMMKKRAPMNGGSMPNSGDDNGQSAPPAASGPSRSEPSPSDSSGDQG